MVASALAVATERRERERVDGERGRGEREREARRKIQHNFLTSMKRPTHTPVGMKLYPGP